MAKVSSLLLLLALAAPLCAQEKKPQSLAVGYPSTTIVYVEGDVASLFKSLSDPGLLKGLGVNVEVPDLGKLVEETLEIELTDAEVRQIVGGMTRASIGLLDITVNGPKFEIIARHEDPSVLEKALARALSQGSETVVGVDQYEGVKVYQIAIPLREKESNPEDFMPVRNPFEKWFDLDTIFIAVSKKTIIAATSINAVKDSIDYLAFPDDTTDTLVGNKRFKDALAEFKDPDGLIFVNTTSLINTMERVSGDKGNSPLDAFFGGEIKFSIELMEYKQLKSVAAGYWIDEKANTVRMDARVQFHNEPGWYNALKLKPVAQPLTEFVPEDTLFGLTYGIEDPLAVYNKVMELLKSRAKEGGQEKILKALTDFENKPAEQGVPINEVLSHIANFQALLVLPKEKNARSFGPSADVVGLFGLRDVAKAEDFLYGKILRSELGKEMRKADLDITMIDDVEIHHAPLGGRSDIAFAFVKDVFIFGDLNGIKRVVEARKNKKTLSSMPVYKQAREIVWEKCGGTAYLNLGAFIKLFDFRRGYYWEEPKRQKNNDATAEDAEPLPYLSRFFSSTVVVWGTQARENELAFRIAIAGWPAKEQFKALAEHFRDVGRNKEVRDDFVEVLSGATAHYALKGKAPTEVRELEAAGYVAHSAIVDPYGEDKERHYKLAPVPDNVDIRQPILLAFQEQPGLGGKHLAVLWNGWVVKLTPAELAQGLKLSAQGQPLSGHTLLKPLYKPREGSGREPDLNTVEVTVIDDDGTERIVAVDERNVIRGTEEKLDNPTPPDEPEEDEE